MSTSPDADARGVPPGPPPHRARVPAWAPVRVGEPAPPVDGPALRGAPAPGTEPSPDGRAGTPAHLGLDGRATRTRSRRLRVPRVTVAAAGAALLVSAAVATASLAGDGRAGDGTAAAPTASPTPSAPATASLDREVGRLQVDLAVARATLAGAHDVDPEARRALERAVIAAQAWLKAHVAPTTAPDADRMLREVGSHRDGVATLVARMTGSRATPTVEPTVAPAAPTPRATRPDAPARPQGSTPRRTAAPTPTPAPAGDPTPAPSPVPATPAPSAAPAPTTVPGPTPGPTTPPEPTTSPGDDEPAGT
ncbi:hypothetical protein LJN51_15710 [Cellulomonas sp. zg-B12]|nr:hypothetical protein [Cellulomonas xiejunii]